MKECRVGLVGLGRGRRLLMNYCKESQRVHLVAVCDQNAVLLDEVRSEAGWEDVCYYSDFDAFLQQDMDVVLLANYATEHAPLAIAAMKAGKHVISEVLPVQNMAEAVALLECVEETGRIYCYAENYCYMGAPQEMKKAYQAGQLGEFEYGEGEYMHNCEPIWTDITHGDRNHWRNAMSAFFYCTHSVGPLLHITGLRPRRVVGLECAFNARMARMGARAGGSAVEMVTLENGAVIKSLHGVGCSKNSVWYSVYGSRGRMESAREDAGQDDVNRIYRNLDSADGADDAQCQTYLAESTRAAARLHGHGGSDYYCLHSAFERILGNEQADTVDVYQALDMWMCGFFGYLSVLAGGVTQEIPDLRKRSVRDLYRKDRRCCDPRAAGEQLLPSYSRGTPSIPEEVYTARQGK